MVFRVNLFFFCFELTFYDTIWVKWILIKDGKLISVNSLRSTVRMTDMKELKVADVSTKSIDGPDVWQIHKWIGKVRVIFSFILIIIMIMIILLKKYFKLSNAGKRKAEVETKCYNTIFFITLFLQLHGKS